MRIRRMLTVFSMALAAVLALAIPASAHEVVQLDESDVNPLVAPLILDGTDPIGWFGVLPKKETARSFQINLQAGQPLGVVITIPDKAPENTLSQSQQPRVFMIAPNGTVTVVNPTTRIPFPEPGRGVDLLVLREYFSTAGQTGTYSFIVHGPAPARFLVATGIEEEIEHDFHGMQRGELATQEQFDAWYATAP
jgi:hypothetical protein